MKTEEHNNLMEKLKKAKETGSFDYIDESIQCLNEVEVKDFGLVYRDVPEVFIKPISENEVVYGDKIYEYFGKRKNNASKPQTQVVFDYGGEEVKAKKEAHSFSFLYNNKYFLTYGNDIYIFKEETKEEYIPYLIEKGKNFKIGENAQDLIIEGDNYFALQSLMYTHEKKIDIIYIDPPYNTGNKDFKYNDQFIKGEDGERHSAWLSFMEKRLGFAKELLKEDGIIFIHIDEAEIHNLTLLMNQIFGEHNQVEEFIWEKNSTKNNSKTTSTNHEYIICYAKNKNNIEQKEGFFKKNKNGYKEVMEIYNKIIMENITSEEKQEKIEKEINQFYKQNKDLKGISQYRKVDKNLNIFRIDNISAPGGNGKIYDVIHPMTKKKCSSPSGGFRYSKDKMSELLQQNRVFFGKDEKTIPQYKRFLSEVEYETVKSVINDNSDGNKDLSKLFNKAPFNNPKPINLMKTFIKMIPKENATILDFFAGSGGLGETIWNLNKEDGGNRSFILCTNNENNICEDVTFERLKRANEKYQYNQSLDYLKILHAPKSHFKNT